MVDRQRQAGFAAALICLLMGAYLLTYTGRPGSADGSAIAAVSASLWRTGRPLLNAQSYSDALFPVDSARMGTLGADGALYSKKGLSPSLALLPLIAAGDLLPGVTALTLAALFNAAVTTLTALLLFAFCSRLGFAGWAAFCTALVYGLGTLALPYVHTLFGEPLAALLLLAAVYALDAYRGDMHGRWLAGFSAALGMLIGVNTVYLVTAGLLAAIALLFIVRRQDWPSLAALILPLAAFAGLYGAYNMVRFGSPFTTGYRFEDGEGFTFPFLTGVLGLTVSPYRGVFWYSPVVLLALPGAWLLSQKHGFLVLLIGLLTALQVALFAAWWSWDGGVVWGTRFLVPVLPLLMLLTAPVIRRAGDRRWLAVAVALLAVISFGVALSGALVNEIDYTTYLVRTLWNGDIVNSRAVGLGPVLTDPLLSPIIGHLALLLNGWQLQPVWAQMASSPLLWVAPMLLVAIGGALILLSSSRRRLLLLTCIVTVAASLIVATAAAHSPGSQAVAELETALVPRASVYAATTLFDDGLLDLSIRAPLTVVNAPTGSQDQDARPLWDWQRRQDAPYWLINWFPPADPANWQEREAFASDAFVRETGASGHRALLFYPAVENVDPRPSGVYFSGPVLDEIATATQDDGLYVALTWRLDEPRSLVHSWFVHVLDANGAIISQQDRQPQGGYRPISDWQRDEQVVDRLFFPDVPGAAALRIGWVTEDGEPGLVAAPDGVGFENPYLFIPLTDF